MTVAQNAYSRVFLTVGGSYPDREPQYESCFIAEGLEQSFGDLESIECPDPNKFGAYVTVGEIQGASERPTLSLTGRYALDTISRLARAASTKRPVDVHVNFGTSTNPGDVNAYTKKVILVNARISSLSTDPLGSLQSGDTAAINETFEMSGDSVITLLPLAVASLAGSTITNEVIDVIVLSDTGLVRNGYEAIYALTKAAGGSPSTPADVVYSLDSGSSWRAHDVDSLGTSEPTAIGMLIDKIVVVSNADASMHYADLDDFDAGVTDPAFTEVTTGIVATGEPNDLWVVGNKMFVVGDLGYIYKCTDATAGLTVLSAGAATSQHLRCVHAYSAEVAIAGGDNGVVVYTLNGETWTACNSIPAAATISAVWAYDDMLWWAATNTGKLFYTKDRGASWTEKTFSGSGSGVVRAIAFHGPVMYLSHSTTTPAGRLYRSTTAGYGFVRVPEATGTMPANDRLTAVAVSSVDPNFVAGGGLDDNGSDGIIIVASA